MDPWFPEKADLLGGHPTENLPVFMENSPAFLTEKPLSLFVSMWCWAHSWWNVLPFRPHYLFSALLPLFEHSEVAARLLSNMLTVPNTIKAGAEGEIRGDWNTFLQNTNNLDNLTRGQYSSLSAWGKTSIHFTYLL